MLSLIMLLCEFPMVEMTASLKDTCVNKSSEQFSENCNNTVNAGQKENEKCFPNMLLIML